MTNPYRNINDLREWLKANSSGVYRPSAHAATVIEEKESELTTLRAENDRLRAKLAAMESQKPVCYANSDWIKKLKPGTLLNRAAVSSEKTDSQGYSMPLYANPVTADKPRITEQDAREIAQSALMFWRNTVNLTLDVWMKDHAPALLNKLNADREQVPSVTVPDGWKLVPIEATKEMLSAGALYDDSYRDMLAAAPSAPDSEGVKK